MTTKKEVLTGVSTNEIFTAPNITRRVIRVKRRIFEIVFHFVLAVLGAAAVAIWAVPAALVERGYQAIGGEWLLVILTFVAVFYASEVAR